MSAGPVAVLFDAGGTLVHLDAERVGDLLGGISGVRPDPGEMIDAHYRAMAALAEQMAGEHEADVWAYWIRHYLADVGVPVTEETVTALATTPGLWTRVIPGAPEMLAAVKDAGYRIAVVSNADGTVRAMLEQVGIGQAFEMIVDSSEEGTSKPGPEIFRRTLERLGLAPEDVWYVGDSPYHDVGGAQAAGLAEVVLVDPLDLHAWHPMRVATVAELPALLGFG